MRIVLQCNRCVWLFSFLKFYLFIYLQQLEKEDQEESFDLHHCFSLELIKEKTATSRIVNYEKSNLPERTLLQVSKKMCIIGSLSEEKLKEKDWIIGLH